MNQSEPLLRPENVPHLRLYNPNRTADVTAGPAKLFVSQKSQLSNLSCLEKSAENVLTLHIEDNPDETRTFSDRRVVDSVKYEIGQYFCNRRDCCPSSLFVCL